MNETLKKILKKDKCSICHILRVSTFIRNQITEPNKTLSFDPINYFSGSYISRTKPEPNRKLTDIQISII